MSMHALNAGAATVMKTALSRSKPRARRGADGLTDRERQKLVEEWGAGPGSLTTLNSDGQPSKPIR